jgi:hypothetical protein
MTAHYKMVADIVFTDADFAEGGAFYNDGAGWEPIGTSYGVFFTGTFDGDGHTITGLKQNISASSTVYGGLFGLVNKATIKNLGMEDAEICVATTSGTAYAGGIVGYVYEKSTISNCYNTGAVTAESSSSHAYAGGIAGYVYDSSTISNCYNTGTVSATAASQAYAGGVVGYVFQDNAIDNCYNTGAVTASSSYEAYAGGIAGYVSGSISNCYYLGTASKGVGSGTDTAIKCTTTQMKQQATFVGFDFTNTWTMAGNTGYPYPELIAVPMVSTEEPASIDISSVSTTSATLTIANNEAGKCYVAV